MIALDFTGQTAVITGGLQGIGKAIADDFCGKADDFKMLSSIQHQDIPFGRTLAPVVVPLAKSAYSLGAMVNPGKMVSF